MKIKSHKIILLMTLFVIACAGITAEGAEERKLSWEDYRVISQRNIFSKNRAKKIESFLSETQTKAVAPGKEESYLILRGITKQGDSFTAFIEDSRSMEVKQVKKGTALASGKISEINIDFLKYEVEGKSTTVKMGMAMEGTEAPVVSGSTVDAVFSSQQSMFNFSTPAVSKPDTTSADDKKSILERLKERRKKELAE